MDNWQYHDKKMKELKQLYLKTSKQTQNRLQEIIDTFKFDFGTLYNIADTKTKKRVNTYIEEWKDKGLLTGYFGTLAKNIYGRTRVKNSEILELLIYGAYIEEQNKIQEQELNIMYDDANYYYQEGQQEVNDTLPKKERKPIDILKWALFLALMDEPNVKGYVFEQYVQATIKYNADQIYRQMTIDLQQQNSIDITNDIYQNLIRRQGNSKLNIKDGKATSGDIDLTLIGLNNNAKIEGIKYVDKNAECLFISDLCEHVTLMCSNMHLYKFKVDDWNSFDRWYGETAKDLKIERIKVKGLVLGINLPPITHHFHWCHSTIMYLPKENNRVEELEDEDVMQYLDINNYIKKDITKQKNNLIRKAFKNDTIREIALNNDIEKIYIYGKKSKHRENKIYLNTEWKHKSNEQKSRTIRHEVGHAIDYKYNRISCKGELSTALEIDKINILKNKENIMKELKSKEYLEYAELSDIIGGLTNNEISGRYKHSNNYWKRPNALEKETFADLFAIAGGNDIKYLQIINRYLPNTLKAFDNLIRRIE